MSVFISALILVCTYARARRFSRFHLLKTGRNTCGFLCDVVVDGVVLVVGMLVVCVCVCVCIRVCVRPR